MYEKIFQIKTFLKRAVASKASDIHLMCGDAPFIRKNGQMRKGILGSFDFIGFNSLPQQCQTFLMEFMFI